MAVTSEGNWSQDILRSVEWSKYSGSIHSDIRTDEITETWPDLIKSLEEERRQEIRHRSRQSAQPLNPERVL